MNHIAKWVLISVSAVAATPSWASGGTSSGGSEFMTTETNPWFIGAAPVTYCIEIDPAGFSASEQAVDAALLDVFHTWRTTIAALQPEPTPPDVLDGQPKNLSTVFAKEPCSATTELRFVLGAHTPEILEILRTHARYTFGFANSTSYDEGTGRSHGIVWLAADVGPNAYTGPSRGPGFWQMGSTMYNVILHELGHTYGFAHTETGVMLANAPLWAILGGSPTRYSTQGLVMQHWLSNATPVCGWVATDGEEMLTMLLGPNHGWPLYGCLTGTNMGPFQLQISNNAGLRTTVDLSPEGRWPVTSLSTDTIDSITGNYQRINPPGDGRLWQWHHIFVSDENHDELVSGTLGGHQVKIVMQTQKSKVRFIVGPDAATPFHYFYIEYPLTDR